MEKNKNGYKAFSSENESYHSFLNALHDGKIEPGSIMTQTKLCEVLNISMTPLRECLILLEEYGLVEVRPRAGVQIISPDISFFRSNMQFRTIIERAALPSFIEKYDHRFLMSLKEEHEKIREEFLAIDDFRGVFPVALHEQDRALHVGIVKALRNKSITAVHDRVQDNLSLSKLVHVQLTYRQNLLDTVDEHLALMNAILAGDVNGALAAHNAHLRASTHRTFT